MSKRSLAKWSVFTFVVALAHNVGYWSGVRDAWTQARGAYAARVARDTERVMDAR